LFVVLLAITGCAEMRSQPSESPSTATATPTPSEEASESVQEGVVEESPRCTAANDAALAAEDRMNDNLKQLHAYLDATDPGYYRTDEDLLNGRFIGSGLPEPKRLREAALQALEETLLIVVDNSQCFDPGTVAYARSTLKDL